MFWPHKRLLHYWGFDRWMCVQWVETHTKHTHSWQCNKRIGAEWNWGKNWHVAEWNATTGQQKYIRYLHSPKILLENVMCFYFCLRFKSLTLHSVEHLTFPVRPFNISSIVICTYCVSGVEVLNASVRDISICALMWYNILLMMYSTSLSVRERFTVFWGGGGFSLIVLRPNWVLIQAHGWFERCGQTVIHSSVGVCNWICLLLIVRRNDRSTWVIWMPLLEFVTEFVRY